MTASLFLDPADNYIKVNYFPEEPKWHQIPATPTGVDYEIRDEQREEYDNAVADVRASALTVKDQEVGDGLIHFHHAKSMDFMVEPNVLYPIPGLTFKEVELCDCDINATMCFMCTGKSKLAILELPSPFEKFAKDYTVNTGEKVYMVRPTSSNNTPDNTVPIEQQESQELVKEVDTLFKAMVYGVLYERSDIPMADIDYASYWEAFSGMYERMLKDLKINP